MLAEKWGHLVFTLLERSHVRNSFNVSVLSVYHLCKSNVVLTLKKSDSSGILVIGLYKNYDKTEKSNFKLTANYVNEDKLLLKNKWFLH